MTLGPRAIPPSHSSLPSLYSFGNKQGNGAGDEKGDGDGNKEGNGNRRGQHGQWLQQRRWRVFDSGNNGDSAKDMAARTTTGKRGVMAAMGHGLCVFFGVCGETTKNKEESKIVMVQYPRAYYPNRNQSTSRSIAGIHQLFIDNVSHNAKQNQLPRPTTDQLIVCLSKTCLPCHPLASQCTHALVCPLM
jgi:hypothetical protein